MDVIEQVLGRGIGGAMTNDAVVERFDTGVHRTDFATLIRKVKAIASQIEAATEAEDRVAVFLSQSSHAYAAELAALYSGRTFCPLEPSYPPQRISHCLSDLGASALITDAAGARQLGPSNLKIIDVASANDATSAPAPRCGDNAYIIFTSGSTGLPKGVQVSRASMNKFLSWSQSFYDVKPGDRWAQFSSLGFDLSLVDLLTCLPMGGTLVPVTSALDRMLPARFIRDFQITVWHSVPSAIPLLVAEAAPEQALSTLRLATFCGEPLFPQQVEALLQRAPQTTVINTYGPTEGTFFCSYQVIDRDLCAATSGTSLPIGSPIPGWQFEFQRASDDDDLDELIIASPYIARGYISATTDQERFGVGADANATPFYRTGDLVRRVGSNIYFARRLDNQVKIRGNRLDLGEVEYHSLRAGAQEAKAFLHDGRVFLAVVLPSAIHTKQLRDDLSAFLPKFAMPADIFELDSLPRNVNAKVDTNALRELARAKWDTNA